MEEEWGMDVDFGAPRNHVSMLITLRRTDGDHLWWMLVGMPSEGIEGEDWEELCYHCKKMSTAAGVQKPHESQKARVFFFGKCRQPRAEENNSMTQNAKTTSWEEIKRDWNC